MKARSGMFPDWRTHPLKTASLHRLARVEFGEANHFTPWIKRKPVVSMAAGRARGICCYLSANRVTRHNTRHKTCIVPSSDGGEFVQDTMGCGGQPAAIPHFTQLTAERSSGLLIKRVSVYSGRATLWPQPIHTIAGPLQQRESTTTACCSISDAPAMRQAIINVSHSVPRNLRQPQNRAW